MPIYEYECLKCGERFELRRSIADKDSDIKCPRCGKPAPKRVVSLFSSTSPNVSYVPTYREGST